MPPPATTITGLSGTYKGRSAPVHQLELAIGRDKKNGLCFPLDLTLSREHAQILFDGRNWVVRDLGSSNGTYVNNRPLEKWGQAVLRPGDEIHCGFQVFRLDWVQEPGIVAPPVVQVPARTRPSPTAPVELGNRQLPPPSPHIIPSAHTGKVKPASVQRGYQWVKPGEVVVIQGRTISCGLFFFGQELKSLSGFGQEPSLIIPLLEASQDHPGAVTDSWSSSYRELSPRARATFLDWLAAGRPPGDMTDNNGLLFLAGIERAHIGANGIMRTGIEESVRELHRLVGEAPPGSKAAISMRSFLIACGATQLPPAEAPLDSKCLDLLSQQEHFALRVLLARRIGSRASLNATEALIAVVLDEDTYPRTPVFRCTKEIDTLFRRLYDRKYPQGIAPKLLSERLDAGYRPANPQIFHHLIQLPGLAQYRIAHNTLAKLREFLVEATEALDPYSRRLAGRSQEAGKLPAVSLLPAELLESDPTVQQLSRMALSAHQDGGALKLAKLADLWVDWPQDRKLSRQERDLLGRALWQAGFMTEPNANVSANLGPGDAVFVAPRDESSKYEASPALLAAMPLVAIAALVVLADGSPAPEERQRAKQRLGSLTRLEESEQARLGIYLDWVLTAGPPKVSKKAFEAVEQGIRSQLLEFLAEVAAADGHVSPVEVKEIIWIAKQLGVPEKAVYPMLHAAPAVSAKKTVKQTDGHGLDMDLIVQKIVQSRAASEILGSVFVDDEEQPVAKPEFVGSPVDETRTEDPTRAIIEELSQKATWSAIEFQQLMLRHAKMPSAAFEDLNEAAFDFVGDPLLEGDDPITVDMSVAEEMLK